MAEQLQNFGQSVLNEDLTAGETDVDVADGSVFPATGNFRLNCEDEIMICTARTSNTLTVTRGAEGTTGVIHATGAYLTMVLTAGSFVELVNERTVATKLYMFNNFK